MPFMNDCVFLNFSVFNWMQSLLPNVSKRENCLELFKLCSIGHMNRSRVMCHKICVNLLRIKMCTLQNSNSLCHTRTTSKEKNCAECSFQPGSRPLVDRPHICMRLFRNSFSRSRWRQLSHRTDKQRMKTKNCHFIYFFFFCCQNKYIPNERRRKKKQNQHKTAKHQINRWWRQRTEKKKHTHFFLCTACNELKRRRKTTERYEMEQKT